MRQPFIYSKRDMMYNRKVGLISSRDSTIKKDSIKRCGIIPYTIIDGIRYFCFGIDYKTKEITDFAGRRKKNESLFEGARREFTEESLGAFDNYLCDLKHRKIFTYKDNYITFIRFYINNINEINEINEKYYNSLKATKESETCGIIWFSEKKLLYRLHNSENSSSSDIEEINKKYYDDLKDTDIYGIIWYDGESFSIIDGINLKFYSSTAQCLLNIINSYVKFYETYLN